MSYFHKKLREDRLMELETLERIVSLGPNRFINRKATFESKGLEWREWYAYYHEEYITLPRKKRDNLIEQLRVMELNIVRGKLARSIADSEFKLKCINDLINHGRFSITWWSRDCDMVEGTSVSHYTSFDAYQASLDEVGEWAEGPVTTDYLSQHDVEDFEPSTRDRVMEAYENGNGRSLYV